MGRLTGSMEGLGDVEMARFNAQIRDTESRFPGQHFPERVAPGARDQKLLVGEHLLPSAPIVTKSQAEIMFDKLDEDESGVLTLEELAFRLSDEGFRPCDTALLFTRLDSNHDGSLDKEEFIQGFETYMNMKKCGLQRYHVDAHAGASTFNLPTIDVSNTSIGSEGFEKVFTMIQQDLALETLKLANTKLPNSAIIKITKFASAHPTITELDLSGNAINDSAGRKLLLIVQTNRAISVLVLKDTSISAPMMK